MANTNAMLVDATTRHAVFVNRYAGSQLKQMLPYLQRVKKATAAELAGDNLTEFSRKRLDRLYKEIDGITVQILAKMNKKLSGNMESFSSYEADFTARMLSESTKVEWDVPAKNQIHAAIFAEPVAMLAEKGIKLDTLLDQYSEKKSEKLIMTIQDGVIAGKTNQEIIKDMGYVIDTNMADGLNAVVRTVTNHVSSVSTNEVYKDNDDIVDGYYWSSTLDDRTTETCQALDGQFFKFGEGPMPPAHWGCRSRIIPVVKKQYSLRGAVEGLTRPAIGPKGPQQNVPSRTDYNDWLKKQPASFQDEVLGKTKGALFREGGLSLDKFVDKNYQPLTIAQLRESDNKHIISAFKRAGLDADE